MPVLRRYPLSNSKQMLKNQYLFQNKKLCNKICHHPDCRTCRSFVSGHRRCCVQGVSEVVVCVFAFRLESVPWIFLWSSWTKSSSWLFGTPPTIPWVSFFLILLSRVETGILIGLMRLLIRYNKKTEHFIGHFVVISPVVHLHFVFFLLLLYVFP